MKTKQSPLTKLAIAAIEDVKGFDLKVLDVRTQTTIADTMLICTGTSNRHVRSIADNVLVQAKAAGYRPRSVQGLNSSEWVLVDLGDVLVHVMQAQTRIFYQLEKLWDIPEPELPVLAARKKTVRTKPKSTKKEKPKTKPAVKRKNKKNIQSANERKVRK